jgi:hypothetical protein
MKLRRIVFELECKHEGLLYTSLSRLSKGRLGCLIGEATRSGLFCEKCKAKCQPVKFLRLESYEV